MADGDRSWEDWEVVELQENWDAEVTELRDRLAAAEARVEALTEALRRIAEHDHPTEATSGPIPEIVDGQPATVRYVRRLDARDIARAALAAALPERQEEK